MENYEHWVEKLELEPHPEGGYYKRTYTSDTKLQSGRACSSAIIYLLHSGEKSRLHRLGSDEMWHFYGGESLTIHQFCEKERYQRRTLGQKFKQNQTPQVLIPSGNWFGATVDTGFSLVGCTVTPSFHFDDFELADEDELKKKFPEHKKIIDRLT
ncbi:MAG: cupin domain-containing protein [bacterium]